MKLFSINKVTWDESQLLLTVFYFLQKALFWNYFFTGGRISKYASSVTVSSSVALLLMSQLPLDRINSAFLQVLWKATYFSSTRRLCAHGVRPQSQLYSSACYILKIAYFCHFNLHISLPFDSGRSTIIVLVKVNRLKIFCPCSDQTFNIQYNEKKRNLVLLPK